ncbi:leucine--tRNA ligase [Helicobacter sp. XJK30-2]|uniref:Leucine--tRNA ligase n=1 Tax=Helicobacter zhangjianzhongii TaxID=2974574 RepID=A0ACC6FQ20_9HELI|nr:leucine--tRNA ligase [Helicobacter sp. XJK30-2]MDL0081321.1 leucine--tRNA ligase [Helicobacter sp. XJK30-2]
MRSYNPKTIEKKWQQHWAETGVFEPEWDSNKPKKYILSMFPYPSGAIHMGHVRNYCIGDALARYYRNRGFNVLHPIGFDAFGMPAENAAIKHKLHPKSWTYDNMNAMRAEFRALGLSFSAQQDLATCDPIYTKWEQEFFIEMWEKGLIYRKKALLNWCPKDLTVLANEQVIDGKCWRCDTQVVQKEMEQYYIKITDYAEELLEDLQTLEGKWSPQVLLMQKNWIGKSHGLQFGLSLESSAKERSGIESLEVFTTRPDTIFGVTYCAIAPEHPLVQAVFATLDTQAKESIIAMQNTSAKDRAIAPKQGVDLGVKVIHPLTDELLPVWVANFVLMDYGSGAVMSVPAHDERDFDFAKKYGLPIKQALQTQNPLPCSDDGAMLEGAFKGLSGDEARQAMIKHFEQNGLGRGVVQYRLRDWGVSRQRYWGAPIPIVHCDDCGAVPERLENLPITLPEEVAITGEGNPLASHSSFMHALCPKCGKQARRESDTMDTFVESSWYFLRYATRRDKWEQCGIDTKSVAYWLQVDEYIGGIEHAILHLLYARFFTKVLRDLGYHSFNEPFAHLLTQGMVLKDGAKMAKSKGNVVNPKDILHAYGADTARLFILFAAPPIKELEWNDNGVEGANRFIRRLYERAQNAYPTKETPRIDGSKLDSTQKLARKKLYEALQKSQEVFTKRQNNYNFNTLIASCMEAFNALNAQDNPDIWTEGYFILLSILEPIIPHICWELSEELFGLANFGEIKVDSSVFASDEMIYAVTINGKKRAEISVQTSAQKPQIIEQAKQAAQKWLLGTTIKKEVFVPNKLVNFVVV